MRLAVACCRAGLVAGLLLLLAGCAGDPGPAPGAATAASGGPTVADRPESVILVEDRFEPFNRRMYRFNFEFDHYVFLPLVRGYRFIVPRPLRQGISNFFSNLGEVRNATNGLLQARPEVASRAAIRFLVNSTVGVLGFFDVAGRLGADQQREDFGQTLGWWGVESGPYLVLPILGPSSLRDAAGLPVDLAVGTFVPPGAQVNDVVYNTPAPYPIQVVDARETQPFRYYDSGSAFEYDLIRFLYLETRDLEIRK